MLDLENQARLERAGIWAHDYYHVHAPDFSLGRIDHFELVEGTVLNAADVKGRFYLNFGDDWRTDFTLTISGKARKLFASAGIDPLDLTGQRIRARGWVRSYNGPTIKLTHPEQLEILTDQ